MNLLSKLSSSTKAKTIEPREIFMTLPSKAPGYGYPRDVQSEVWKKWFDIRNEKNVITRIETNKRYVTDLELKAIAEIFQVSYIFLIDGKDE